MWKSVKIKDAELAEIKDAPDLAAADVLMAIFNQEANDVQAAAAAAVLAVEETAEVLQNRDQDVQNLAILLDPTVKTEELKAITNR